MTDNFPQQQIAGEIIDLDNLHAFLTDSSGSAISVQNPFPTDGDSVYTKDVWIDESDIGDYSAGGTLCIAAVRGWIE